MADILIVDDELPIRKILRRYLDRDGHRIREAGDAQEAEAAMAAVPADVVLCDIWMPGEHDGIWLTNDLRRRYPQSAVVLVTGDRSVPPATSLRAGVVAYLIKPFSHASVLQAVALAVDWHLESLATEPVHDAADALNDWLAASDWPAPSVS
jgi:DNA-binding NtrC family response regulator